MEGKKGFEMSMIAKLALVALVGALHACSAATGELPVCVENCHISKHWGL